MRDGQQVGGEETLGDIAMKIAEYDVLIERLESQLYKSRKSQQQHTLQLCEELQKQQPLNQDQELVHERPTPLLVEENVCLPKMEALISMTAQVTEFLTFDDAAIFFSKKEWNEWKEVEGLLEKHSIMEHNIAQPLLGSATEQKDGASLLEFQDTPNGGISEISSTSNLRKHEGQNPEKHADTLQSKTQTSALDPPPINKLLSIKEKLKKLHCPDQKELCSIQHLLGTPATAPHATKIHPAASSPITAGAAGDLEHDPITQPYLFDFCEKLCISQEGLVRHRQINSGQKPFDCSECGRSFLGKGWLNRHRRSTHPGVKTFVCNECGVYFASKGLLELHQKIHVVKKRTPEKLSAHLGGDLQKSQASERKCTKRLPRKIKPRGIPAETLAGGKTFACKKCEKKFITRYYLLLHMKKHVVENKPAEAPLILVATSST
ncbi:zinc finger protein 250-like isoform X2 [Ambystoma mexicanum]|uniref:zinc finger protein 250-like isoform X2 n=1 Tax=Ambystoma mexicanum TaxID=8296 RepID=UPI0037E85E80